LPRNLWQKALYVRFSGTVFAWTSFVAKISEKINHPVSVLVLSSSAVTLIRRCRSLRIRVLTFPTFSSDLDIVGCSGQLPNSTSPLPPEKRLHRWRTRVSSTFQIYRWFPRSPNKNVHVDPLLKPYITHFKTIYPNTTYVKAGRPRGRSSSPIRRKIFLLFMSSRPGVRPTHLLSSGYGGF
jgi:hypothetical protein